MKSFPAKRVGFVLLAVLVASGALLAADIPLANWTVPPYQGRPASSGGITTMTDISPGVAFVAVEPCRIVDTRGGGVFVGAYGPPALVANATRNFDINSAPHCTGIPSGVEAYSLNFTVVNTAGGSGDLRAWPTGSPPVLTTSVLNWTAANVIIANATIIGAGTGGQIDVTAAGFGTQLLIDINGYFTDSLNTDVQFIQVGSVDGGGVIYGQNNSAVSGSSGILGWAGGGTNTYGVEGRLFTNAPAGSAGVHGISNTGSSVTYGGEFENTNTTTESAGVIGDGDNATGETYGVLGDNDSTTFCSAGAWGRSGANLPCNLFFGNSGVLGTNTGLWGILGMSNNASGRGVQGNRLNGTNTAILTAGVLGYIGNSGVHSFQDVTAAGNKPFVEPHPRDASKQIKYVSLEGNEVGTYFRGRARFQRGLATIEIPEDFRMVTEPEGLSIQITPIGEMASYAVVSIDLDRIVVKGSRNVEFFYTVNGVRHNYADFRPIGDNVYFIPESPNDQMIEWPETHRRLLIQNGTLKPDGTINMETARRLGWDQKWEKEQLRVQAEQAADREADRQGLPEGTIKAQLPD
jgi:hypothetical protein